LLITKLVSLKKIIPKIFGIQNLLQDIKLNKQIKKNVECVYAIKKKMHIACSFLDDLNFSSIRDKKFSMKRVIIGYIAEGKYMHVMLVRKLLLATKFWTISNSIVILANSLSILPIICNRKIVCVLSYFNYRYKFKENGFLKLYFNN